MNIRYRIVAIDHDDCSITVRFWSDGISEHELRTDRADTNDPPLRCRTDVQLTLWTPMTEQELHDAIVRLAPYRWLKLIENVKAGAAKVSPAVTAAAKQAFSVALTEFGEIDLTDQLTT